MKLWKLRKQRPLILEMLVALCLAFLIWLYAHSRAQDHFDISIPVTLQLSPSQQDRYEIDVQGPRRIMVSFVGSSAQIRELRRLMQRGQIKAVIPCSVPDEYLQDGRFSEKLLIEPGHIAVPPGVSLVMEEGISLQVTFDRVVERQLPVRLDHPDDVRVRPTKLVPAMVTVRGPQEILDQARFIPTRPYNFTADPAAPNEDSVVQGQVDLVAKLAGRIVQTNPKHVSFTCLVQPKQKIYELTDVPVLFLCPPDFPWRPSFGTEPDRVTLRILGPPGEDMPAVQVFLDLSKGNWVKGRHDNGRIQVQLPRDFQLEPKSKQTMAFYLDDR